MKRLLMAVALVCFIACTTLAGDVPTVGLPQPLPNTTSSAPKGDLSNSGEIPSGGSANNLSADALSALLSVLGYLAV
jgi:hypothetical protein